MATLVLSTVGGIVGGPIGAAIGGLLGQAVDRDVLFRPKGREGPRLTDLAVQTSSYGTPLPRVFGTMRVAGCVIWSTDLIESHATSRSGKGQPSVTNYSYAASFAVALSARCVAGVGRIWADGTLLRGLAGDWKSDVGAFRLHTGGEDQPADPLIAAAEGEAPAHRGLAYAVFEQMQLATFGNRIPSLTFELIADAGPVSVGAVAAELGHGEVDGSRVSMPIAGFSAYGDSIRGVLETLADACGGWWASADGGVALRCGGAPIATVVDAGAGNPMHGTRTARRMRTIAAIESVPRTVTVTHYDPARDYQAGLQRARRPGAGEADRRIELPAVLSADAALAVAEAALARAEAMRTVRTIAIGADDALEPTVIVPGSVVAIAGEAGSWRVTDAALEQMVTTLTLVPLALAPAPAPGVASGGRVLAQVDAPVGRTLLVAAELPPTDGTLLSVPRVTILAAGTGLGWRRAALLVSTDGGGLVSTDGSGLVSTGGGVPASTDGDGLVSTDGGGRWVEAGGTAMPATIGTIASPAGWAPATLFDDRLTIEVELARPDMTLTSADDPALDAGANLALAGDELIQFGRAAQIGPSRWRLSRLLRGRRGTEAAIGTTLAGDRFALLDPATAVTVDLPMGTAGNSIRIMAVGVGEAADPPIIAVPLTGASVCPPSPVLLRADRGADGVSLDWVRRSRSGWRWIDGTDVPLAEEAERYRVTIGTTDYVVETPALMLAPADAAAEAPAGATPGTIIVVRQLGINGASPPATLELA